MGEQDHRTACVWGTRLPAAVRRPRREWVPTAPTVGTDELFPVLPRKGRADPRRRLPTPEPPGHPWTCPPPRPPRRCSSSTTSRRSGGSSGTRSRSDHARVLEAASGREGLDLAAAERPELIVLDLGLPDMPGADVCRDIRALVGGADRRALGAALRRREGGAARRRRRRLRHEAVQHDRVAGARARAAAARARLGGRPGDARVSAGDS